MDWSRWRSHFEANAGRAFPPAPVGTGGVPAAWIPRLARSLARFQAGETSEGRLAHQIGKVAWPHIDDDYRASLRLFVKEEARHARILGGWVRALGGPALEDGHWSKRLFVLGRRAAGVRGKLLVAFGAEVAGLGFYGAMAGALPEGGLREALAELCADEQDHLVFHADFWRAQATSRAGRVLVSAAACSVAAAAAALVVLDHRETFRTVGLSVEAVTLHYLLLLVALDGLLRHGADPGRDARTAAAPAVTAPAAA